MSTSHPLLGQVVLGRYRIIRDLAKGGMGAVYLGRTEGAAGFTRPVVIKSILPDMISDPNSTKMFAREARILSNFQHPNIVSALDFGEDADAYLMVLEYVHGYDVGRWSAYLNRLGREMPVDHAIHIMSQTLDALHHAHTLKRPDGTQTCVVHRDVSPTNILLSVEGHVKILDFGIARMTGETGEYRTRESTFKGKLAYAPPELLQGEEPSPTSDTYSAAVVFYQLLAGKNPFRGKSITETLARVMQDAPTPISEIRPDAPAELDAIFARALAKNPADRYTSAAELSKAIREVRSGSKEDVAADFLEAIRRDFTGNAMPSALDLEPLTVRDQAWREAQLHESDKPVPLMSSRPPTPVGEALPMLQDSVYDQVTEPSGLHQRRAAKVPAALKAELESHDGSASGKMSVQVPARSGPPATLIISLVALVVAIGGVVTAVLLLRQPSRSSSQRYLLLEKGSEEQPASAGQAMASGLPQPALVPGESPAQAQGSAAPGSAPDPTALTRTFTQQMSPIQDCLTKHREHLGGTQQLSIFFSIDTSGKVGEATLAPGKLTPTPLGKCVLDAARAINFGPQPAPAAFRIPLTTGLK